MRFFAYAILLFSISAAFYFMGYEPGIFAIMGANPQAVLPSVNGLDCSVNTNLPACVAQSENNATPGSPNYTLIGELILVVLAASIFSALVGGFAAVYIIPLVFVFVIYNLMILPANFVFDASLPEMIRVPILALLNILCAAAVVNFIRGNI